MTERSTPSSALSPEGLEIVPLDAAGRQWDEFVRTAEGSYSHRLAWRDIMSDVLGHECLYRMAIDREGQARGALPLVRVRHPLLGHYLVSMPFLNRGGPVGSATARQALAEWAVWEAGRSGADLLELRARGQLGHGFTISDRKITVTLELPGSTDALWESFPSKLRTIIKRPARDGLRIAFGEDQIEPFYEVFARNMRDLGTPVMPRRFFEQMGATLGDIVVFAAVYKGNRPIAGQCSFEWDQETEMVWGSSLREFNRHKPTSLIHWEFMKRAVARGVKTFDFGRCTPDSGTHQFKKRWGGIDVGLPWAQWSPTGVSSTPSPDRPVFRLATAAWQRLPLPVANRLGPLIARSLP